MRASCRSVCTGYMCADCVFTLRYTHIHWEPKSTCTCTARYYTYATWCEEKPCVCGKWEKWGDRRSLPKPITRKSVFGFLAPSPWLPQQHLSVWLASLTLLTHFLVNFFVLHIFLLFSFFSAPPFFGAMPAKGQVQVIVIMAQEYSWAVCVCVPVIYLLYNAPQFPHRALIFPRKLRLLLGLFASISSSHNCGLFTFFSGANFSCESG